MSFAPKSDEEQARTITRLVDGTLSDAERPAVEEWARQHRDVNRDVEQQRRVADELRAGGPRVPGQLIDTVRARLLGPDTRARRWLPAPAAPWRPAVAAGALLAVLVVAVSLTIALSGGSTPSIPAAARLAFAPATQPAPGAQSSKLLDVSYAGITYPNYAPQFGAVPTGQRLDRVGGRPALTVFYRLRDGSRLSYTVFTGTPVPLPANATSVVFDGVPLRVFTTSRLAVVTLVRFGRTCVLAAPTNRDTVLALAAAPIRAQAA